jgi:RNA polymerase sigma-70 factor (ECF subfamily)
VSAASRSAAFEALVAAHGGEVLRVCRAILRDEHLGADAAQETLLRLWRRAQDGSAPERPGAWLRQVAITSALSVARSRAARRHEDDARAVEAAPARSAAPVERLADAELRERFERALDALPDGQRAVFLLRHEAGLPLAEVAQVLGVTTETVKTQFARAALRLQQQLALYRPDRDEP